jgi:hypothetical protein
MSDHSRSSPLPDKRGPVATLIKGFRTKRRPPDDWASLHLGAGGFEAFQRSLGASDLLSLLVWTGNGPLVAQAARLCAYDCQGLLEPQHAALVVDAFAVPARGLAPLQDAERACEAEVLARFEVEAEEYGCFDDSLLFRFGTAGLYALRAAIAAVRASETPSAAPGAAGFAALAHATPESFEREHWRAWLPDGQRDRVTEASIEARFRELTQHNERRLCELVLRENGAPSWEDLLIGAANM